MMTAKKRARSLSHTHLCVYLPTAADSARTVGFRSSRASMAAAAAANRVATAQHAAEAAGDDGGGGGGGRGRRDDDARLRRGQVGAVAQKQAVGQTPLVGPLRVFLVQQARLLERVEKGAALAVVQHGRGRQQRRGGGRLHGQRCLVRKERGWCRSATAATATAMRGGRRCRGGHSRHHLGSDCCVAHGGCLVHRRDVAERLRLRRRGQAGLRADHQQKHHHGVCLGAGARRRLRQSLRAVELLLQEVDLPHKAGVLLVCLVELALQNALLHLQLPDVFLAAAAAVLSAKLVLDLAAQTLELALLLLADGPVARQPRALGLEKSPLLRRERAEELGCAQGRHSAVLVAGRDRHELLHHRGEHAVAVVEGQGCCAGGRALAVAAVGR
eukprot:m.98831 g.98831  ORF g.98831 m.98831 type:complete len:386 (-) comp15563_c0_seq3:764-1921(-)